MKKTLLILVVSSIFILTSCPDDTIIEYDEIGWYELDFPYNNLYLNDMYFKDTLEGWVLGSHFTNSNAPEEQYASVFHTLDGGKTWEEQLFSSPNFFYKIHFIDDMKGFVVGKNGMIFRTNDAGRTWDSTKTSVGNSLRDITFLNQNDGWVVGAYGTILKTTDGGDSWNIVTADSSFHYLSIEFLDERTGFIAGGDNGIKVSDGKILTTIDAGETWTTTYKLDSASFRDLDFEGNYGIAVGELGYAARTTDRGITWQQIDVGTYYPLNSVEFIDENKVWICGYNATVFKSYDSGENWRSHETGQQKNNFLNIYFLDDLYGWLIGNYGIMLYTFNGGEDVISE